MTSGGRNLMIFLRINIIQFVQLRNSIKDLGFLDGVSLGTRASEVCTYNC